MSSSSSSDPRCGAHRGVRTFSGAPAARAGRDLAPRRTGTCRVAGLDAPSTPSRITGPLPALMSIVKIVSITSSLSARPPHVECGRPLHHRLLDLEDTTPARHTAWSRRRPGSRRGRARSAGACRPRYGQSSLPSRPSQKREIRIQPRAVRAHVAIREMEAVLHVVDVADLEIAVDLVELLGRQQQVLDLRPADPLDADADLATRQRLRDDPDQLARPPGTSRSRSRARRSARSCRPCRSSRDR